MNHTTTTARILDLLNQKNHFLEKFYSLNESEARNFSIGNFDNLDYFYNTREQILEVIKYLDADISEETQKIETMNDEDRMEIQAMMAIKEQYVAEILQQDLEILETIEKAKSDIIRELQDIKKSRTVVNRYKVPTFDNRLDEEA